MSPCADWIDNARLKIALRQEAGEEDIFRSVYCATTRTLRQLGGGGTLHIAALSDIVKRKIEWMSAMSVQI